MALTLACSLFALLLLASAAGAAVPTFDSSFDCNATAPCGSFTSISPTFVAVSQRSGDVYVIDSSHDAVDVFDASGNYLTQILGSSMTRGSTSFSFGSPGSAYDDIAVDNSGGANDGNIYVSSGNSGKMFAFNSSGAELWETAASSGFLCGDAVDGAGAPWLGDYFNGAQALDPTTGSPVGSPLLVGQGYCNLAFDSAGNFAAVSLGVGVSVFDSSGNLLHNDNTGFVPTDVAIDPTTNDVYTVDTNGVTIWDPSGNVVTGSPFGPVGPAVSTAVNPVDHRVYVSDTGRVDIYDMPVNHTVTVRVDGTGNGTVDADLGAISGCRSSGGTCSDSYGDGSTVRLAAAPSSDSNFTGWTNCDAPNGNICTVSVTSDRNVTATFDLKPRYTLRVVTTAGTGSGTVTSTGGSGERISCPGTCQATELQGDSVLLSASAAPGSTFTGWSGGGCSGTSTCPLTMNADTTVTATFAQTAPVVATGDASGVGQTAATVSGTVNPEGVATSCRVEYGTSTSYGSSVSCSDPGTGTSAASVSATLSGLTAGTAYHYRVVASNAGGTSNGDDRTFSTASPPVRTCQTDPTLCPPPTPGVLHLARAVATALNGKLVVKMSCVGRTACHATLQATVRVKQTVRHGRGRHRFRTVTVVVAKGSVNLAAGSSGRVTLKLTRAGRQMLARSRQIKTTLAGGGFRHTLVIRNGAKPKRKH